MTEEEKICPFISKGQFVPHDQYTLGGAFVACIIVCQREKCMAWEPKGTLGCKNRDCPVKVGSYDCLHYPNLKSENNCPKLIQNDVGYCK